ncbi:MAG: MG2 domain-containing protein, partial [bacterium]|nr:MG2 domain-containing protein [bacterium]
MRLSLKIALKVLMVLLTGAGILALSYYSNWSLSVKILMFSIKYWWLILILFSVLNSTLRWKILKKKPYWITLLLIFAIGSAWAMPVSGKPTLLFYLAFLFITSLIVCLALDRFIWSMRYFFNLPYVRFFKKPTVVFISILLLLLYLAQVFRRTDLGIINVLLHTIYLLVPLAVLVYGHIRKRYFQKTPDILKSIALFVIISWIWPYYPVLINSCVNWLNSFWTWALGSDPWKSIFLITAKHHAYGSLLAKAYKTYQAFIVSLRSLFTNFTWLIFIAGWIIVFKEEIYGLSIRILSTLRLKTAGVMVFKKENISRFTEKFRPWISAGILKCKEHKQAVKVISVSALIILTGIWIGPKIYQRYTVFVVEFTPQGEIPAQSIIRVAFSGPIISQVKEINQLECFDITPKIDGEYKMESDRTIVFIPASPLKPSTKYTVSLNTRNLKAASGKHLASGNKITFNTELFKVANVKLFYLYDLARNVEKRVMGEISFNYPVEISDLQSNLQILHENEPIQVELERSSLPERFYFKTGLVSRAQKETQIECRIKKDLSCIGGAVPLADDFKQTVSLPAKEKLEVSDIKLWHEPGSTFITIMFNMPVSKDEAETHISLIPYIPCEVQSEYCYTVLKANFQPNRTYEIRVAAGTKSASGESLENERREFVRIEDLPASVKFANSGKILPLNGEMNIALKTVNLDQVNVSVEKVFKNNLIQFFRNYYSYDDNDYYSAPMSSSVYNGSFKVDGGQINEEVTQYINLRKLQNLPYKGVFKVRVSDPHEYYNRDSRWILCSDLGLIAKNSGDDLAVYVLAIKTLNALPGIKVKLISTTNQVMEEGSTDESGKVIFSRWQHNENGFIPYFLIAEKGEDWSFLKFDSSAMEQYGYDIGGEPYTQSGMEAFLTPERDLYRPGEKAYLTGIIRNKDFTTPPELPVRLIVTDPQGAEFARQEAKWNQNGVVSFTVDFPLSALTGHYQANLYRLDQMGTLGVTSFKVEDFIPDKLKVEINPQQTNIGPGEKLVFTVFGNQLFGAPAAGSKVTTSVRLVPRNFTHPKFTSYKFSNEQEFSDETLNLGEGKLDNNGKLKYEVSLPFLRPPSALNAYVYTEVFDSGGREVSGAVIIPVDAYPYYLGAKVTRLPIYTVGNTIKVDYVAIDPSGQLEKVKNVQLLVKRRVSYSIFKQNFWGRGNYESSSYEEVILQNVVEVDGRGSFSFKPDKPGSYKIYIGNEDSMCTSLLVNVTGPGYQTFALESPEKLKIGLDKESYANGENAIVSVRAPFSGKLFLTVEREKVYYSQVVNITGNTAEISVPVTADYLPNVYITGLLVRTPEEDLKSLPMTSFGITPLYINKSTRTIDLSWDIQNEVEARTGIQVKLRVPSDTAERTNVILSAVDEGILQITNFKTPDPLNYFYRKKAMTTATYSIFNLVLPDLKANKLALGGDGGEDEYERRHLNPIEAKKPKSLAIYSGILTPDQNGEIQYHFDTTGFNGQVRVMAMAVNGTKYGSGEKAVTVADPIVLLPNLPRFASPLDQFQIPVGVYNKTGKAGNFKVLIRTEGPVEITSGPEQAIFLDNKQQARVVFFARCKNEAGVATVYVTASGSGYRSDFQQELGVRPFTHLESVTNLGMLKPGQEKILQVPAGYIKFGQKIRLSMSSNPLIQYLACLDYLIGYPYGCAEQVTSKIFPLLYFKEIGLATGIFGSKANAVDMYVQAGIEKLEKMQLADGSFTMWPGGTESSPWISLYVSHALLEANRLGYKVNPRVLSRIRSYIIRPTVVTQNTGRLDRRDYNTSDPNYNNVYMIYLKALNGTPDKAAMQYLSTVRLQNLGEVDRALLSMSFSEIGDKANAVRVLAPDFKSLFVYREQYGSFNSPIRNTAMYLSALAQADKNSPRVNDLIRYLGENMKNGRFGNTQECAWVFISLGKAFQALDYDISTSLLANGQPYKDISGKNAMISDNTLSGKTLTLKNTGAQNSYFSFLLEGTSLNKKATDSFNGIKISRKYLNRNGQEINLSNVAQGELVVVNISVEPMQKEIHNLVIVDLLPAGLEVENTRLASQGEIDFEPENGLVPAYQDIRDDRVLLFVDAVFNRQSFSYTARAVTP